MKKRIVCILLIIASLTAVFSGVGCKKGKKEFDKDGRMILDLRNLYFAEWSGGDYYTEFIEDKFNVAITPTTYSWADWNGQVNNSVTTKNLSDVFHYSLDNYNFANSYIKWADPKKANAIKALPEDMSRWPNLKKMLDGIDNIDKMKIDGKLYCIPLAKNIKQADVSYSPFTYIYRRDWAKQYGVYKENDVYTWEEFQTLLKAFYEQKCEKGSNAFYALVDVEWGFPSITNFFKDVPHCFDIADGKAVCAYATPKYMQGLDLAKTWATDNNRKYYGYAQFESNDGDANKQYYSGRVGVFYENLSLVNYSTIREKMAERSEFSDKAKLDDATAIMKVMGPDGKYALEGTDNWFSATFFSRKISDEKMYKILDIMDWTLSEEGTKMATYGIENEDYYIEDGKVVLNEERWQKDRFGNYVEPLNGAKFLRYMTTLSYDTNENDPTVDKDALNILNDWYAFMNEQKANGKLRILKESDDIRWMFTKNKNTYAKTLLDEANTSVMQYAYNKIDQNKYKKSLSGETWKKVLDEINGELSK